MLKGNFGLDQSEGASTGPLRDLPWNGLAPAEPALERYADALRATAGTLHGPPRMSPAANPTAESRSFDVGSTAGCAGAIPSGEVPEGGRSPPPRLGACRRIHDREKKWDGETTGAASLAGLCPRRRDQDSRSGTAAASDHPFPHFSDTLLVLLC